MGKIETSYNVNDHWCTPQEIWQPLIDEWGSIGLDPFSNPHSQIPARMRWSIWPRPLRNHKGTVWGVDSFDQSWDGWGLVFVNGPFSEAGRYLEKCATEGDEVVYLFKANMNARYVHKHVRPTANAIAFWDRRVRFVDAEYTATFHVALGYRGPNVDRFERAYADQAWVLRQDHHDHDDQDRPRAGKLRAV